MLEFIMGESKLFNKNTDSPFLQVQKFELLFLLHFCTQCHIIPLVGVVLALLPTNFHTATPVPKQILEKRNNSVYLTPSTSADNKSDILLILHSVNSTESFSSNFA